MAARDKVAEYEIHYFSQYNDSSLFIKFAYHFSSQMIYFEIPYFILSTLFCHIT